MGCLETVAAILFVLGLLSVALELRSPDALLFTGQGVIGEDRGGLISYNFGGHTHYFDSPHITNFNPLAPPTPVQVYVDTTNPDRAMLDNELARWFDLGFVATPFVAAGLFLLAGVRRRSYFRKRPRLPALPRPPEA